MQNARENETRILKYGQKCFKFNNVVIRAGLSEKFQVH